MSAAEGGGREAPSEEAPSEEEDEGVLCAICHGSIQPQEAALVRGCDHAFCNGCILNWALQKPKCPLCNTQFSHVWLYKQLDGTYNDFLVEESVHMLLQTTWFRKQVVSEFTPKPIEDDEEEYHEMLQYMYGGGREDDDVDEYFDELGEAIARRGRGKRPAVGNRMFGSGGVLQAGRQAVRAKPITGKPTPPSRSGSSSGEAAGEAAGEAGGSEAVRTPGSGSRGMSASAQKKAEKLALKESQKTARREAAMMGKRA